MNGSGYQDPTADQAIARAMKSPKEIDEDVKQIRRVLSMQGLVLDSITMHDRTSGRKYTWRKRHE